jgi:paraquat-inducible protein B
VPLAAVAIVVWLVLRQLSALGVAVTVSFDDAAQMKADTTQVMYRGVRIGKVSEVSLAKDGSKAVVRLRINRAQKKYLNAETRFYLEGASPSLSDPASLKALIAGPTVQMVPGGGPPTRSFTGLSGEAPKRLTIAIPYSVTFQGEVGDLTAGAPVTLRGFEVGEVTAVNLKTDPNAGDILTQVSLALDPLRFHIEGTSPATGSWTAVMNDTLKALIRNQWRARLAQSPPLIGSRQVELAKVPDAPPATLQLTQGSLEIPAVEGGGIEHLVQAAGQFPIREIGDNVREITEHIKTLSASPQLKDSIVHLNDALTQLDQTLREAGPKVAPTIQAVHETVDRLRQTAGELDSTVKAARSMMGTDPAAPDGSLEPTLMHVSEAARAVRVLADYLDEHPESLVKGRLK